MKQQIKYILLFTLLSGIWAKDKKIYISADLEGVVGAVTGEQLGPGGFEYNRFREFMTGEVNACLLYTSPSPRDLSTSRMPSSA